MIFWIHGEKKPECDDLKHGQTYPQNPGTLKYLYRNEKIIE